MLVLLAGCGGSNRVSKAEYERTLNDDGRLLSSVFGSVDQGTTNLHQLSVRVSRARAQLDRVRSDLDDLKPPEQAERAHRQLSRDLERLVQTADAGDRAAAQEARARLSAPARQLVAAIQQLQQAGFDINNG
jgi:plasmid stabilization system protein ParE